jgi:hypothetical protein
MLMAIKLTGGAMIIDDMDLLYTSIFSGEEWLGSHNSSVTPAGGGRIDLIGRQRRH